jgi:hypothetical protein
MIAQWIKLAFVILMVAIPTVAVAQDCIIAPYADPEGTQSWTWPIEEDGLIRFSVYIVMFTEDVVAAAAYKLVTVGGDGTFFLQSIAAGPSGIGLILHENPASIGVNVALAECVIGFGGLPILVAEYRYLAFPRSFYGTVVTLEANTNQNPQYPEYVTCNDVQKDCEAGPRLYIQPPDPAEPTSFSSIKSLYR